MRRLLPLFAATAIVSCSLLVQFDPETQPCDTGGLCADGFVCVMGTDGGICKRSDGGVEPMDASTCAMRETVCDDGRDEDCDGQTDCLDADCAGLACDDKNLCTTGETCQSGQCRGGTTKTCTTPSSICQLDAGTCIPATGECRYESQPDGTSCGSGVSARCCNGACTDLATSAENCGGCGLACATGQTCQPINLTTCFEPLNTSGRCSCSTTCPGSQLCASNSFCKPATPGDCAPRQVVVDAGSTCLPYCRY